MFQKMIEGIFDLIEHRKDIWNLKITIYHSDIMLEEMLDKVKSSLSQIYSLEILDISVTKGPAYQQVVKPCSWYLTDSIISLG